MEFNYHVAFSMLRYFDNILRTKDRQDFQKFSLIFQCNLGYLCHTVEDVIKSNNRCNRFFYQIRDKKIMRNFFVFITLFFFYHCCSLTYCNAMSLSNESFSDSDEYDEIPFYDTEDNLNITNSRKDGNKSNLEQNNEESLDNDNNSEEEMKKKNGKEINEKKKSTSPRYLLNRALSKSHEKSSKILRLSKNNITLIIAIFAFRRELYALVKSRRIQPSTVVKLILLLDVLRKLKSGTGNDNHDEESNFSKVDLPVRDLLLPPPFSFLLREIKNSNSYGGAHNPPPMQHYMFECLNDRYTKDSLALRKILDSTKFTNIPTQSSSIKSKQKLTNFSPSPSPLITKYSQISSKSKSDNLVIVFEVNADVQMTQLSQLRDTITFILSLADAQSQRNPSNDSTLSQNTNATASHVNKTVPYFRNMEIVLLLESPGGAASSFGLASSQLQRLTAYSNHNSDTSQNTNHDSKINIKLTVCVDKVAASGGYMMACQSSPQSLLAAPFAMVGSIGVVSQAVNFYSTLKNWGVKPIVFKAPGEGKAPISPLAEVTKEGMEVVQSIVDRTHEAFRKIVLKGRGDVIKDNLNKVATGEIWMGEEALELGLVDRLITSDEYLGERVKSGDLVLKLHKCERARFGPFTGLRPTQGSPFGMIQDKYENQLEIKNVLQSVTHLVDDLRRILINGNSLPGVKNLVHI